jgi:TatD DNase family protein
MFIDVHCHPYDLFSFYPEFEQERRQLGIIAAASAFDLYEFLFNEALSHNAESEGASPLLLCFGIHPQQEVKNDEQIIMLEKLASEKRINVIGECGYDLFNEKYRETEKMQEKYFLAQIEIALKYDLPLIIHVRRAMHKIFTCTKILSKCKAVIFHSWPGTLDEADSLLNRGVNAYFSFGNVLMLNHKQAARCCSLLPVERLLTETDAPYQARRGESFSCFKDLPLIIEATSALRCETGNNITPKELEVQIEINFRNIFYFSSGSSGSPGSAGPLSP